METCHVPGGRAARPPHPATSRPAGATDGRGQRRPDGHVTPPPATCPAPVSGLGVALLVAAALAVLTVPAPAAPDTAGDAATGPAPAAAPRSLRLEAVHVAPDDAATGRLVRRLLPLAPGVPVDLAVIELARESLEASGYFREVDLYTARGSAPGQVVLHVEVTLERRLRLLTGFGYDPMDGWYLNLLGARLLNRPRPGGELRVAARNGYSVEGVYLEGRLPVGDRPGTAWLLDVHGADQRWMFYERREGWDQPIHSRVARVGRQAPVGPVSVTGWFGYSWREPDDEASAWIEGEEITRPAGELVGADLEAHSFLDFWLEARRDGRDPDRPWWRGTWWGARLRASRELAGGAGFFTLEADGRRTWPLGRDLALAGRLRAAHADPGTPYHQRFQFGGVGSVRGYDFAFLSGRTGAAQLVQTNLELRAALLGRDAPLPRVAGLLFLDTGQSWDTTGGSRGWVAGAGWGVRVRLPWVQYLGVEVGYPLVDVGDISPAVVNVALGWSY